MSHLDIIEAMRIWLKQAPLYFHTFSKTLSYVVKDLLTRASLLADT